MKASYLNLLSDFVQEFLDETVGKLQLEYDIIGLGYKESQDIITYVIDISFSSGGTLTPELQASLEEHIANSAAFEDFEVMLKGNYFTMLLYLSM